MKFRTEVVLSQSKIKIEHQNKIMTIGSCFAENIARYLKYYRFNILENPFGILYNPASIFKSIELITNRKKFLKEEMIFDQEEWHSFYFHSDFSHHIEDVCLKNINNSLEKSIEFLKECDTVIITYGTSYVFEYKHSGEIVSNCHKIPADKFRRYRLPLGEVKNYVIKTIELLRKLNKGIKIILTVSPVRHWKDGAVDNQLSKSTLLLAIHEVISELDYCEYFPSYEIMMDDLRDYRFYESDLVHPNLVAQDYIWEKFISSYFTEKCKIAISEIGKIAEARKHRPRNPKSKKHQEFVNNQLKIIDELKIKYKHVDFKNDYEYFVKQKLG